MTSSLGGTLVVKNNSEFANFEKREENKIVSIMLLALDMTEVCTILRGGGG